MVTVVLRIGELTAFLGLLGAAVMSAGSIERICRISVDQ